MHNDDWSDWQEACLLEFNEKHGEYYGVRQFDTDNPDEYVEFGENGTAYIHSFAGTNYLPNAVTSFDKWMANH